MALFTYPPLKGSPAEISWGNRIRKEAIDDAYDNIMKMKKRGDQLDAWVQIIIDTFVQVISTPERLEASWWIEHRPGRPLIVGKCRPANWEYIIEDEMEVILLPLRKKFEQEHRGELTSILAQKQGIVLDLPERKDQSHNE